MSALRDLFKRARGDALTKRLERRVDKLAGAVGTMDRGHSNSVESLADIRAGQVRLQEQLTALVAKVDALSTPSLASSGLKPNIDVESWSAVAQEGELAFHKRSTFRATAAWDDVVAREWQQFGFEAEG